jgi:hypothetical protein
MNNQIEQVSLMKELAKSAKQRLKQQNYAGEDTRSFTKNIIRINSTRNFSKPQIVVKLIDEGCQSEFCEKVKNFLNKMNNDVVTNPMSELVDKCYMESLNPVQRQRYIFDIAEKYNKIKQDYYNEQFLINSY